ncbi:hypothetical protein Fmac_023231 [Flemingia macrophylla]|uniref:Uncharacterized protein n=1 Tax=Flemingia macrophylla TaxID=520843 RepID=A0ABD1LL35_9FABA
MFFCWWNEMSERIVGARKEEGYQDGTFQDICIRLIGLHIEKGCMVSHVWIKVRTNATNAAKKAIIGHEEPK